MSDWRDKYFHRPPTPRRGQEPVIAHAPVRRSDAMTDLMAQLDAAELRERERLFAEIRDVRMKFERERQDDVPALIEKFGASTVRVLMRRYVDSAFELPIAPRSTDKGDRNAD